MAFWDFLHNIIAGQGSAQAPTQPTQPQAVNAYPAFPSISRTGQATLAFNPQLPAAQAPGAPSGGGGGAPGGTYNPQQTAPAQPDLTPYRNTVMDRIHAIQGAYDSLNGGVDQIVNDRATQAGQNYDQQLSGLQKSYANNAQQQAGVYGARGLGDSSYYGNAQQDAGNTYQQGQQDILNNRTNTLGQLGQYAATTKAQYGAGKNAYQTYMDNINNYDQPTLQSLGDTLQTNLGGLQAQQAGLGTNQDFLGKLNQIAPVQNQASSQMATKLQQLITSGAPQFAKNQIAQGLVKQAQLTDPNAASYWNDYWNKLLSGQA